MELKRAIKKLPSEQNLRLLSSLIVSIANKQSSLEDRVIAPWSADVTYQKDISYVSHNGYVYICSVTNQDSVFTESHWTKLADNITELDVDTIKSYLNLTQEQITTLQSLIDDTTITTTKTNSSSKIYMDIQAAIAECKDDTLKQIAKKVSGSYKIAASTSEVTSADYIYLINNGVNYDLYVLVDSVPTKVGDTSIDLSDYAKTSDLEADYLKKTDATSTYATITTVDGKVDKTSIKTAKDNSATDEQVYSAKAINTELDKKVNKTDITTTINSTSTDDTVPSTKAVYNTTSKFLKTYTSIEQLGLTNGSETIEDIANSMEGFTRLIAVIERPNISIYPHCNGTLIVEKLNPYRVHFKFCIDELPVVYVGTYHTISGFSGWKRLCATSVADVPLTTVSLDSSKFLNGHFNYEVKNGICYVYINALNAKTTFVGYDISPSPMPKPSGGLVTAPIVCDYNGATIGLFYIDANYNSRPRCHIFTASLNGYVTFSYTVAES